MILRGEFKDADGNFQDPTSVTFSVLSPDKQQSDFPLSSEEVTKVSDGVYQCAIIVNQSGLYQWRMKGSGVIFVSNRRSFRVAESPFTD